MMGEVCDCFGLYDSTNRESLITNVPHHNLELKLITNQKKAEHFMTILPFDDNLPNGICKACVVNVNSAFNFRTIIINNEADLKGLIKNRPKTPDLKNETQKHEIIYENDDNHKNDVKEEQLDTRDNVEVVNFELKYEISDNLNDGDENLTFTEKKVRPKRKQKPEGEFRQKCQTCGFVATSKSMSFTHWRSHQPLSVCPICGKLCPKNNLQKHVKNHTVDPVTCEKCGKVYKNAQALKFHDMLHRGVRHHPATCDVCGKHCNSKSLLRVHKRKHSENDKFACTQCDKKFLEKAHLTKHMQVHTGDRPHACPHCDKRLSTSYALKCHIRIHTNEKPYICEFCPMAFKQRSSVTMHMKSRHTIAYRDYLDKCKQESPAQLPPTGIITGARGSPAAASKS